MQLFISMIHFYCKCLISPEGVFPATFLLFKTILHLCSVSTSVITLLWVLKIKVIWETTVRECNFDTADLSSHAVELLLYCYIDDHLALTHKMANWKAMICLSLSRFLTLTQSEAGT